MFLHFFDIRYSEIVSKFLINNVANLQGQMNDASELLWVIFDCFHQSMPCEPVVRVGSWDCKGFSCIAHSVFGMDITERMKCDSCSLESRHLNYTTYFRHTNASALREMKACLFG